MEWSTESIEKVISFVQERPFLFDVSSAELAWTCMKIWCKKLAQETCARFLTVCHHHKGGVSFATVVKTRIAQLHGSCANPLHATAWYRHRPDSS